MSTDPRKDTRLLTTELDSDQPVMSNGEQNTTGLSVAGV